MKKTLLIPLIVTLIVIVSLGGYWIGKSASTPGAVSVGENQSSGKAGASRSLPPPTKLAAPSSSNTMGSGDAASGAHLQTFKKASPLQQAAMFKDPKYVEAIKKNIISKQDSIYGEFYQKLPIQKVQALQQIQADQLLWLANNTHADGSPPSIDEFTQAQYDYDMKMKDLLGAEDYKQMLDYRKTVPDRTMVSSFASRAAQAGLQVSPQEIKAVESLVISKRATLFEGVTGENVPLSAPPDPNTVVSKNYTEAEKQQILETHAAFNEKMAATNQDVLQSAASVLDPAKLTILSDVMSGTAGYEPYVKAGSTHDTGAVKVNAQPSTPATQQ